MIDNPEEKLFFEKEVKPLIDKNNNIKFLGPVNFEKKVKLYQKAKAFLFPVSWEEPFGLTMIEAMACGAPILASDIEPMPEICQDAAIYFDPFSPQDISEKIKTVLENNELLQNLRQLSVKRATYFSWEDAAKKTLHVFESCH